MGVLRETMTQHRILDVDSEIPDDLPTDAVAEYIAESFSHFAAYHACDGRNLDAIRREGLVPLDVERLRREAGLLFSHLPPDKLQAAVSRIEEQHFDGWYEETVGVFVSGKGSLSTDWLKYPWFVWRLAIFAYDNGQEADAFVNEYMRHGTPTFVRCVVPVEWIKEHIHPRYDLLRTYADCIEAILTDGYTDLMAFLYGIKGGVPAEFIRENILAETLRGGHNGDTTRQIQRARSTTPLLCDGGSQERMRHGQSDGRQTDWGWDAGGRRPHVLSRH